MDTASRYQTIVVATTTPVLPFFAHCTLVSASPLKEPSSGFMVYGVDSFTLCNILLVVSWTPHHKIEKRFLHIFLPLPLSSLEKPSVLIALAFQTFYFFKCEVEESILEKCFLVALNTHEGMVSSVTV